MISPSKLAIDSADAWSRRMKLKGFIIGGVLEFIPGALLGCAGASVRAVAPHTSKGSNWDMWNGFFGGGLMCGALGALAGLLYAAGRTQ
jgi:hypothetical protein